ncbi:phage major capsid protein [Rhizobium sp. Rhizsp82]|uniref:phage major capsid protein n=1 Tax=Rhizobium sp. Rhizsp82 TaxID=3243057 RepID=UPI0039B545F5
MTRLVVKANSVSIGSAGEVIGIAWPFGSPDSTGDVIRKGAISFASNVPMVMDHYQDQVVGIWQDFEETDDGLIVKGQLFIEGISPARDAHRQLKSRRITGLSISWIGGDFIPRPGGGREYTSITINEISLCRDPVHPGARVIEVKSAQGGKGTTLSNKTNVRRTNVAAAKKVNKAEVIEGENDNNEQVDGDEANIEAVDERVTALEAEVAEIKQLVEGTGETVDEISKSVRTLVTKSGRPAPAIIRKSESPEDVERKAFKSYLRHGAAAPETKSLRSDSDPKGGYLAPPDMVKEMLAELVEFSPVRSVAKVGSTGSNQVIIPGSTGQGNAGWVGELEDSPESDFGFSEAQIDIFELATFIEVPNATLADAAFDLEGHIKTRFAEDFGKKESLAFVSGNGIKKPEGFLTRTDIPETVSGGAADITADAFITLMYAMPAVYRAQGSWALNGTTLGKVRKLKDGQGNYLWQPAFQAGQPETILGRPVVEMIDMPDIAAGAYPVIFGDWSGYRIYDREEMSVLVDPFSASKKRLTTFHASRRTGGSLVEPKKFRKLKVSV